MNEQISEEDRILLEKTKRIQKMRSEKKRPYRDRRNYFFTEKVEDLHANIFMNGKQVRKQFDKYIVARYRTRCNVLYLVRDWDYVHKEWSLYKVVAIRYVKRWKEKTWSIRSTMTLATRNNIQSTLGVISRWSKMIGETEEEMEPPVSSPDWEPDDFEKEEEEEPEGEVDAS